MGGWLSATAVGALVCMTGIATASGEISEAVAFAVLAVLVERGARRRRDG